MKVVTMQPSLFPWMPYLRRIARADMFIVLDHVELDRSSKTNFVNRAKILNGDKETWLSIGVDKKQSRVISSLKPVANKTHWTEQHLNMIKQAYRNHPQYRRVVEYLSLYYHNQTSTEKVSDSLLSSIVLMMNFLDIDTPYMTSTELLDWREPEKGSDLILQLCDLAGADEYISGKFGKDYLDVESFTEQGIDIEFDEWLPKPYSQHGRTEFVQGLSTIDVMMNHGRQFRSLLEIEK